MKNERVDTDKMRSQAMDHLGGDIPSANAESLPSLSTAHRFSGENSPGGQSNGLITCEMESQHILNATKSIDGWEEMNEPHRIILMFLGNCVNARAV
jgi:hypothetical protein